MPTLADTIAEACGKAVAEALADDEQLLKAVAEAGGHAASNGLLGDVKDVTSVLSNLLGDIPVIGGLLADVADPLKVVEESAGKFGTGFGLGWVVGQIGAQLLGPLLLPAQHLINAHTTNELYDPNTAAQLTARGIIPDEQGRSESSGNGLDVPHFENLVEASRQYPALAEALRLLNLQAFTEADVQKALERQGVPQEHWGPLMELRRALLSPADLALANLRGEMDDETMLGYASQLGVDADDMRVLVNNTGEPPGLMQMLEALRRGYMDEERLTRGVKQSRVRDEWIDVILKLRYQRMSPIDAIRALVQNHLDEPQARQIALEGGLAPEDFDPLYATYGNPISAQEALSLYHRGDMSLAEVKQAIKEGRIKDKYVDSVVELGRRLIPYRTINTILSHGIWTPDQGVKYLMQLGYTEADATALVSTATAHKTAAIKSITEAQIIELYEARAITEEQATELLRNVGYDGTEAKYIVDATDAKASLAEQKRAISAVRASYLADRISIGDASNQLDAMGVLAAQRDKLTKDWEIERAGIVKTLTAAQWASAVYYGIVEYDYAVSKCVVLGYSKTEAEMFVDIRLKGLQHGQTESEFER